MTVAVFLVTLGASLRLTRLFVEDTITAKFRARLAARWDAAVTKDPVRANRGWMYAVTLFECPWCIGFWISCLLTAGAAFSDGSSWYFYPAVALTVSYLIGVCSTIVVTIEEIN